MAARLQGLRGSKPAVVVDVSAVCMSLVVQVEASVTGRSFVQGVLPSAYVPMYVIR